MEGKTGLIMGVANERSIAWGIANQLFLNKANIVLTYQNDSLRKRIEPLSEKIKCKRLFLHSGFACYLRMKLMGIFHEL